MTIIARPVSIRWVWFIAIILMLGEFLLFDRMTSRHHASIYPRWNDQIQYLTESYLGYEEVRTHGLWAGLHSSLTNPAAQGTVHDTMAVLVFYLVGSPSRSAALSLNLFALLAWQGSLLLVFHRAGKSWTVGWLAFGLLPCLFGPWSAEAGSAVDFRLDHAAMCLFGVCSTVALLTRGFRSTGWSAGLGFFVGFTVLERFLTSTYFVAILLFTAVWILCGDQKILRLRNLLLAGLVTVAMVAPVFWINWTTIYNYYWVGHITSSDAAARAPGLTTWGSLQFIWHALTNEHLGTYFGWVAAIITLPLLALRFIPRSASPSSAQAQSDRDWLFMALAFLLLPALILTFHPQKSSIVVGVLVPGIFLLLGWLWAKLLPPIVASTPANWRLWPIVFSFIVIVLGEKFYLERQLWEPHSAEFQAGARRVNQISDYIFTTSRAVKLATPRIGVDQVTDSLDAQIMRVITYERKKTWMSYQMLLPTGILAEDDKLIYDRLAQCDFVLLTDEMPGPGYWPYDRQMRRLYPSLKNWCESHLHKVENFPIFGRKMSLYERPEFSK